MAGMPLPASWEREGVRCARAIAREFAALRPGEIKVVMTLDARLSAEPGPWHLEPIAPGEHAGTLRELSSAADFTVLIAPETSGVLARLTRDLEQAGAQSSALRRRGRFYGRQASTGRASSISGIDTPPSVAIVPGKKPPECTRYPAVLKPVDCAGSVNTFYLDGPADLPEDARAMPRALLQPFVPGEPHEAPASW